MYWISQGDCAVNIIEQDRQERIAVRLLVEGDHFGEIGLIYNCCRSASIVSRNYNTMARLRKDLFHKLVSDYPEYKEGLLKHIYKYKYKKKKFLRRAFNKISYMRDLPESIFHKAIYSLRSRLLEKDEIFLKEGDNTDSIIIVEKGILEFYTTFESNPFIIEQCHSGFVLNHKVIFMDD